MKVSRQAQSNYSDCLADPSFRGVTRLFVSSFESNAGREGNTRYFLAKVGTKDYEALIDERNVFDETVKNVIRTYEITR